MANLPAPRLPIPSLPDAGTKPAQMLGAVQLLIQSTIALAVAIVAALGGSIDPAVIVAAEGFAAAVFLVIALKIVPARQMEAFQAAFPDALPSASSNRGPSDFGPGDTGL